MSAIGIAWALTQLTLIQLSLSLSVSLSFFFFFFFFVCLFGLRTCDATYPYSSIPFSVCLSLPPSPPLHVSVRFISVSICVLSNMAIICTMLVHWAHINQLQNDSSQKQSVRWWGRGWRWDGGRGLFWPSSVGRDGECLQISLSQDSVSRMFILGGHLGVRKI